MPIRDFRDLIVWQRAVELVADVYELSSQFPKDERFGMMTQIRRAAVSVASNIAEGSGRGTTRDLVTFLTTSRGSLYETQSLILVSQRLGFVEATLTGPALGRIEEVGKMLSKLRSNLRTHPTRAKH
jgi:four helix bundle protein